jgi:hypothetical protein
VLHSVIVTFYCILMHFRRVCILDHTWTYVAFYIRCIMLHMLCILMHSMIVAFRLHSHIRCIYYACTYILRYVAFCPFAAFAVAALWCIRYMLHSALVTLHHIRMHSWCISRVLNSTCIQHTFSYAAFTACAYSLHLRCMRMHIAAYSLSQEHAAGCISMHS